MSQTKYSSENIFAKILKGEIPCDKVYEDEFCLAFNDKFPVAKVHVLVVPKFEATSFDDFVQNAPAEFIANFYKSVQKTAEKLGLTPDVGYRLSMNTGKDAGQSVFHYHVHILSGLKTIAHA